jgi:hypothetical protein
VAYSPPNAPGGAHERSPLATTVGMGRRGHPVAVHSRLHFDASRRRRNLKLRGRHRWPLANSKQATAACRRLGESICELRRSTGALILAAGSVPAARTLPRDPRRVCDRPSPAFRIGLEFPVGFLRPPCAQRRWHAPSTRLEASFFPPAAPVTLWGRNSSSESTASTDPWPSWASLSLCTRPSATWLLIFGPGLLSARALEHADRAAAQGIQDGSNHRGLLVATAAQADWIGA